MVQVLVIDDEEEVRFTLQALLEAAGHEVKLAVNGRDGVAAYKAQPADLVITDIIMPDQEGIETITQLYAHDPKAKVIAMSGGGRVGNMDFLQIAQRLGAKQVLRKPIRPEDLTNAVTQALA